MRRPAGITVTTLLLCLMIVVTLPVMLAGRVANHWSDAHGLTAFTLHTILMAALSLALLCGVGSIVWFYFHGRNGARFAAILLCLVCLLPLHRIFALGTQRVHIALILIRGACAVIVLLYQIIPADNRWFASHPTDE